MVAQRQHLTASEKLTVLKEFEASGESVRKFSTRYEHVTSSQLVRWRQDLAKLQKARPTTKVMHQSRASRLEPIKDELVEYVRSRRAQGIRLNRQAVDDKMLELMPQLCDVREKSRRAMVYRLLKSHGVLLRGGSNVKSAP